MVLPILFLLVNAQKKPSKPGSIPMIQALFPMTKEEPCSFPLVVFAFSSAVSLSDCSDLYKAGCIVRYSQAAESIIKKRQMLAFSVCLFYFIGYSFTIILTALMRLQPLLAKTDAVRCDFHQLIIIDPFQSFLQ